MGKYNTFIPRLVALMLDMILLAPLIIVDDWLKTHFADSARLPIFITILNLTGPVYVILMHFYFGQTVGKMLMKIKVLDISENPIKFYQSVLRDLPQLISVFVFGLFGNPDYFMDGKFNPAEFSANPVGNSFYVLFAVWGLADIVVFFTNDKRRALHDFIAGTVVVRVKH